MEKLLELCFKCGKPKLALIPFVMIDDWVQFTILLCQDCTSLASQQSYEASEEWMCPICKGVYCCTICGQKHHTKDCNLYIPDEEIVSVVKLLDNQIAECPNCKSKNLGRDMDRIECVRCGWTKLGRGGI